MTESRCLAKSDSNSDTNKVNGQREAIKCGHRVTALMTLHSGAEANTLENPCILEVALREQTFANEEQTEEGSQSCVAE